MFYCVLWSMLHIENMEERSQICVLCHAPIFLVAHLKKTDNLDLSLGYSRPQHTKL
jgi:hypothetical protein